MVVWIFLTYYSRKPNILTSLVIFAGGLRAFCFNYVLSAVIIKNADKIKPTPTVNFQICSIYLPELIYVLSLYDIHQGKYTEAQKLCQKALDVLENTLGRDHPNVVKVLETIAQLNNRTEKTIKVAKLD